MKPEGLEFLPPPPLHKQGQLGYLLEIKRLSSNKVRFSAEWTIGFLKPIVAEENSLSQSTLGLKVCAACFLELEYNLSLSFLLEKKWEHMFNQIIRMTWIVSSADALGSFPAFFVEEEACQPCVVISLSFLFSLPLYAWTEDKKSGWRFTFFPGELKSSP